MIGHKVDNDGHSNSGHRQGWPETSAETVLQSETSIILFTLHLFTTWHATETAKCRLDYANIAYNWLSQRTPPPLRSTAAAVIYTFYPGRNLPNRLNPGAKRNVQFVTRLVKQA